MESLPVISQNDIEEMRRLLEEQGFSPEELIESGRKIRGELMREMYGIERDDDATAQDNTRIC